MKYELKIELKEENKQIEDVNQKSYFENGTNGKLIGNKSCIKIPDSDPLFIVFKGLNNMTIKLLNDEMIDGSMRCVVDESTNLINLYPINNYCIVEDGKYSFY